MTSLISIVPTGASIDKILVPSKSTSEPSTNITLSFPHPSLFATHPHPHFGNTVGRTTNRIKGALLDNLNGKTYRLAKNDGENSLHGGVKGWGKHTWKGHEKVKRGTWDSGIKSPDNSVQNEREGVLYMLVSKDGDEGFPGTVEAKVWYFEGRGPKNEVVLDIEYEAKLVDDQGPEIQETVIGMTNHAYFNLNPAPYSLSHHTATLSTPTYLVLDPEHPGIPTGELANHPEVPSTANTAFSLSSSASTPSKIRPIDDCFIIDPSEHPASIPLDTRSLPLRTLATLYGENSGIHLCVQSTEPAFQFYTGKFIDVPAWKPGKGEDGVEYQGGEGYGPNSGVCIEPSRYVDCAGRQEWKSMCLLKKGELFGARSRYWAWRE